MPLSDAVSMRRAPLVVMFAASGARMAWSLLFSVIVAKSLSDSGAAMTFQLLFLQSGLIAFLSSSAYARGAHLGADLRRQKSALATYLKFLVVSGVLGGAFSTLVFPRSFTGAASEKVGLAAIMSVGAALTAANAFLQGIVTVREGRSRAFMPVLGVSAFACMCGLLALNVGSLLLLISLWVSAQALTPLVLIARSATARSLFAGMRLTMRDSGNLFALTGTVNAGFVIAVYVFRERWTELHAMSVSATALYVNRYAELALQVVFMALASSPGWVSRRVDTFLERREGRGLVLGTGLGLGLISAGAALFDPVGTTWRFAAAEAAALPIRCTSALCLVTLLGLRTTTSYVCAVIASALLIGGLMLMPDIQGSLFGMQLAQTGASVAVVLVTIAAYACVKRDRARP